MERQESRSGSLSVCPSAAQAIEMRRICGDDDDDDGNCDENDDDGEEEKEEGKGEYEKGDCEVGSDGIGHICAHTPYPTPTHLLKELEQVG